MTRHSVRAVRVAAAAALVFAAIAVLSAGQVTDRFRATPAFQRYARMQLALAEKPAFVSGALAVTWAADSRSVMFMRDGVARRFDIQTRRETSAGAVPQASMPSADDADDQSPKPHDPCPVASVARGRQRACEASSDGRMMAFSRDRNVYISNADGSQEIAVTADGSERTRIKYGVASWVYGEELKQGRAIWWSPDGRKVAFYRFDESRVRDYYVTLGQTKIPDTVDAEAFPTAGSDNPVADVLVYDLASRSTVTLDVRDGQPFGDDDIGYYVYAASWASDSSELRINRTDRRQHHMELAGCSPVTTTCRAIVREDWPTGWVENRPAMRLVDRGTRFIWSSSRNNWLNYYLYDFSGRLINPITTHTTFESGSIVRVDDRGDGSGVLYYMARDGDDNQKMQLHRVALDGTGDVRLTDPAFTHAVTLSPDGQYFADVYQAHDRAPATRIVDANGAVVAELAASDVSRMTELHLRPPERYTYLAADGQTVLPGSIAFPSDFDPARAYPVLVSVYGGPEADDETPTEAFVPPSGLAELGFLVVSVSSRAAPGYGRRTLDTLYRKLGQTEIDDMALGIKALWPRPYVDRDRVGIFGTSYGGYVAVMELLRHPDVFAAAVASSAPTDWRNYDTIYTERYMGLPSENEDGYAKGSPMTYAAALRGPLLIYYGTADNNVHPANSLQLIDALDRAGKTFDVLPGPDEEHSAVGNGRLMEFFVTHLIDRQP